MEMALDQDQKCLIDCLSATLDTSHGVRSFAEESLKQASRCPGYGAALAKIIFNNEIPFGLRQMAFRPILHGKEDLIRHMIFGNQVAGTGQDFRGMLCIVIKLDDVIVSIAVLRVFGKFIAELPLVTTSKLWQQKVQVLKEQHGLILFEDTALLEKQIRATDD